MTEQPGSSGRVVNRWLQLIACVIAMAAIANLQYAWTLFTVPLTKSLNATLAAVQLAFTLFVLAETWLVPVEGYLIDKLGARLVVTMGSVLVGAGWIGSGMTSSLTGLYFWYVLGGVGAGAVYGASIGTALKWFPDRRGLATGLTAGAYGGATALTIIPIQNMMEASGYQRTFIVWGIIQGIIVLVVAQLMRSPEAGWRPAGWTPPAAGTTGVAQTQVSRTPWEMLQTSSFWILYVMMTMVAFGGLMVTAQLRPIAQIYGQDKAIVWFGLTALTLALMLDRIINGITRPFWGWVSDHIGRYNTMAITFFLEAVAIFALVQVIGHPLLFVVLSGFVFFAWGNIYSLFPAAIGDLYGPKYATTNYGLQYTAKGTASIFAGFGAAWLVDVTGTWTPVLYTAIVCDLIAAALAWFWLRPLAAKITSATSKEAERRPVGAVAVPQ